MKHFTVSRPLSFFDSFDREFGRDFDRFFSPSFEKEKSWKPLSRVKEEDNYFHLALDIPGVDKEQLKVDLKDNILNIAGERSDFFKDDKKEVESSWKFNQSFSLPKGINLDEIEVHQNNGVLDVILPKLKKQNESKSFEIKAGKSQLLA